jgi:hypothetical protein
MFPSLVAVVGYCPIRRSVLSSPHQSPLAPPLRLVSMTCRLPLTPWPLSAEMMFRPYAASELVGLKMEKFD